MTDHRHMGQSAHPGRRTGVPSALAATALLAVGMTLTGCSSSVSSAATELQRVFATTVVHADGSSVNGVAGLRLRPGDLVRTGTGGRAELVTRSRVVYVGSNAAVQIVDGARQQLRHGSVVVDAQHGPGLALRVAGLSVSTDAGSAVRAERSLTVRLGTLAGSARVTSRTGRQLTIPGLKQTMVGGDALPDTTTPLRLTDDDGESHAVPDLVRDDETLIALARGIDATGRSTAQAVNASWSVPLTAPTGVGRSERILPAVIAAAGPAGRALDRYDEAVRYRAAGGSWAVVARLVGVRASGVVAALAAFERTQPPGRVGSVAAVLASAPNGNGAGNNGGGNGNGGGGGNNDGGNGGNGDPGQPSPTPSPSSSGGVLDTVNDTVDKVLSILPTPPPTRSSDPNPIITLPGLPPLP
ncbi:MAG: hypothetical protein QOJ03_316 [Frankiaceae bacterium]|nr:hypothetical protein [Frankiaceae bacterium]